jgi:hypothetical protein
MWEETFSISWFNSVVESSDGCLLLTGIQAQNVYVTKTDANGDTLWTRTYDSFGNDEGKCIFETSTGEIIVVGRFDWSPGFIWKLDQSGETLDLEIVDTEIGWAIWSASEYLDNSIISWGNGPSHIARFNRFDSDLNYIDTMISSCSGGDKAFIVEGEYLIFCKWPNITITKTLFEPVAVDENIFPKSIIISLNNYPNPFNPSTIISYFINKSGIVDISIYNIKGQKIKTLINQYQLFGEHKIIWDGKNERNKCLSSGVYSAVLSLNAKNKTIKKLLLIK